MATGDSSSPDLSNACWRCQHWGGLVADVHSKCTRINATLQASPATGCVYWAAGAGDARHADWLPGGFKLPEKTVFWGKQVPVSERPQIPTIHVRPGIPGDALKWDQDHERNAWRAADQLMARARRPN